jgi:Putative metallopeptidase
VTATIAVESRFTEASTPTQINEYIDEVWKTVPETTTEDGVTQVDALVGPLFETTFHEFAHALFDMLRVPVLGREEDAADQIAAYIMLHLGKAEARRLITGAAFAYKTEAEAGKAPLGLKQFADAHGTPAQRFYNLQCIAYGADPQLFGDMVKKGHLPKERAEDCKDEYEQGRLCISATDRPTRGPCPSESGIGGGLAAR